MEKKERKRLVMVFVLVFLLAVYVDMTESVVQEDGSIARESIGGESKEVTLYLEAEDILSETRYPIEIVPELPNKETAEQYLQMAINEIEAEFKVTDSNVCIQENYVDGFVEAEWLFQPSGYIQSDGEIVLEEIPEDGLLMQAEISLTCGEYERVYCFPFQIHAPIYSDKELLLQEIHNWLENEMKAEGKKEIHLPNEINGVSLCWTEEKGYLAYKILILEVAAVGFIFVSKKQKKKEEEEQRKKELELSYPDFVNQLALLLQAGMTTRQAWNRMAIQYEEMKKRDNQKQSRHLRRFCI